MSRHIFRLTTLLLLFLTSCLSFTQPVPVKTGEFSPLLTPAALGPGPAEGLHIQSDPRIELLAVVQYLSGYDRRYGLLTKLDLEYKTDLERAFQPYREHQAVRVFEYMSSQSFSFDAPPAVMLYLSDPPDLEVQAPFTDYLITRAGGADRLGQFISALRDFARQSSFMEFYRQHERFYAQIAAGTAEIAAGADNLALLEAYYGMKAHSYNMILAPMFHPGGFGPRVERPDGSFDIYSITGPAQLDAQGQPVFGSAESFQNLIRHEFAHSFVNPLTAQHLAEVQKYAALFKPIQAQMNKMAYNNWETAVNEHIVRAVTIRMATRDQSQEKVQALIERERDRGFIYIGPLLAHLEQYETQRDQYPTFSDFYPQLIEAFGEAR